MRGSDICTLQVVSVSSTAGHTKHFQTIALADDDEDVDDDDDDDDAGEKRSKAGNHAHSEAAAGAGGAKKSAKTSSSAAAAVVAGKTAGVSKGSVSGIVLVDSPGLVRSLCVQCRKDL
jgi:ribosome biogenesis GTPase A